MSPSALIVRILFLYLMLLPAAAKADEECPTKPQRWSLDKMVEFDGYASCPLNILSPDRHMKLHIESVTRPPPVVSANVMQVTFSDGRPSMAVSYRGDMYGYIYVQWSPTGNAFVVNDSQGSAEGGLLRVFVRQGDRFVDDEVFERKMVDAYRTWNKCGKGGVDPVVIPLRWAANGKSFYVYAQRQVHGDCGDIDYLTAKVNLATHKIEQFYSPQ